MMTMPSIIDIEASGFGNYGYPIEIGIAHHSGDRFCTLITPAPSWRYWDDTAERVHHITRSHLKTHGKNIYEVAKLLNARYAGQTLYSDGWVVDKPWLSTLFYEAKIAMNFSVSPLELILTEQQMAAWHSVKEQVAEELNLPRHRASNDAQIIQETYRRTALLRQVS